MCLFMMHGMIELIVTIFMIIIVWFFEIIMVSMLCNLLWKWGTLREITVLEEGFTWYRAIYLISIYNHNNLTT